MSEESTSAAESSWADGVDVRIARELIEKAKAEGVSLAGAGGLLSHITKMVMEAHSTRNWMSISVTRRVTRLVGAAQGAVQRAERRLPDQSPEEQERRPGEPGQRSR